MNKPAKANPQKTPLAQVTQQDAGKGPAVILFNKPFGVLSQFTDVKSPSPRATLSEYINVPGFYPAGRLDRDSEGLMILTDDGQLQARIANPKFKLPKTYLVQVERVPDDAALAQLRAGVMLKDGITQQAKVARVKPPALWPRDPPVRFRRHVADCWLELTIQEGRNRQVRRMTAAIGHPTLRLVRCEIGPWHLGGLRPGEWCKAVIPDDLAAPGRTGKPQARR